MRIEELISKLGTNGKALADLPNTFALILKGDEGEWKTLGQPSQIELKVWYHSEPYVEEVEVEVNSKINIKSNYSTFFGKDIPIETKLVEDFESGREGLKVVNQVLANIRIFINAYKQGLI